MSIRGKSYQDPSFYDVSYDLAFSTTGPGTFVISTTGAAFFGVNIVATSAGATVFVYDSTGAASGSILWQGVIGATVSTESGRFSKVQAKRGIVLFSTMSTGASQVIYFGPKG